MRRGAELLVVAAGLALALAATLAAFGLPLVESLGQLFEGSLGDRFGLARTLARAAPLLLTGLGMVVAWRAGMYNIGGEGQLIAGALAAAVLYKFAGGLQGWALQPALIVLCMFGGAAWAWIAAILQVRRGTPAVISTILLNFVALRLLEWAVAGPLQESSGLLPQTDRLPDSAMFGRADRQTDFHAGLPLAWIAAALVFVFLFRTAAGFRLRLTGENAAAARAARIDAPRVQVRAMALSGALCGLAGAMDYQGLSGVLDRGFSQNWGFLGIPVALVGGMHPLGAIGSSFFFGALFAGSDHLSRTTPSGSAIVYVIQGVSVLALLGLKAWRDARLQVAPQ